jgi:hypothetical protein
MKLADLKNLLEEEMNISLLPKKIHTSHQDGKIVKQCYNKKMKLVYKPLTTQDILILWLGENLNKRLNSLDIESVRRYGLKLGYSHSMTTYSREFRVLRANRLDYYYKYTHIQDSPLIFKVNRIK